jgi:hypothetical protein
VATARAPPVAHDVRGDAVEPRQTLSGRSSTSRLRQASRNTIEVRSSALDQYGVRRKQKL